MCGGGKGQDVVVWWWRRTRKKEGNEEEGEKGAFPFVNGKPETEKGGRKPRTVVMDGRRAACLLAGHLLFLRGFSIRGPCRSLYYDFGALNQSLQLFVSLQHLNIKQPVSRAD